MSRKKTNEEYIKELKVKNPNVIALEVYIDALTNIRHKCLIHNIEWSTTPSRVLNGKGCPQCHSEKIIKSKTNTNDDFLNKLNNMNSYIVPLEKYNGMKNKIKFKCLKHNLIWEALPDNVIHGHGCPKCQIEGISKSNSKDSKQYIDELLKINSCFYPLDEYISCDVKINHKCKKCGFIWYATPTNVLNYGECPCCSDKPTRITTMQEYIHILQFYNKNITPLESIYSSATKKIKHKCNICLHEWDTTPSLIFQGCGCPSCAIRKRTNEMALTNDEYMSRVNTVNNNVDVLGKYINMNTKIKHKCKLCGNEWYSRPLNILRGVGCPKCASSKGEKIINEWLKEHSIIFEAQKRFDDCKYKRTLPFDFYLPNHNMCIEFDGIQHYKPIDFFGGQEAFQKRKQYDTIKDSFCKDNNIQLLRITKENDIEKLLSDYLL